MITNIRKRDGGIVPFQRDKITRAIYKAARAVGGKNYELADSLSKQVEQKINSTYYNVTIDVETVQDIVEKTLIEGGYAKTSKAYIIYREQRRSSRENNALTGATARMFHNYLGDEDWEINENANTQKSIAGLNNYIREKFTKQFWLHEVYTQDIMRAHTNGDIHIHDLGFYGNYCCGWDIEQLLLEGLVSGKNKVKSSPAKHFGTLLRQLVNATFLGQSETAGAQAWSNFDVYLAPFIRYDNLSYRQVLEAVEGFIFEMNMPTRVGGQCPFSNLTFDITISNMFKDKFVICGGVYTNDKYGDFQEEVNMINKAFCEVMGNGDRDGTVFTFPIPTINVTKDFQWDNPVIDDWMRITIKYGIPYFSNFINSDMDPEDVRSMCCRIRLDNTELRKRGGGLFGSNPLTGSVGVVTINLPRIGYLSKSKDEFIQRLEQVSELAKLSLEIKRKEIERETEKGLYPYCAYYLNGIKMRQGSYWANHFSTIGLIGMNEALLNLLGKDITTEEGQEFAIFAMEYLQELVIGYQKETGNMYNLEATPAEGTSYRLANLDKSKYTDIVTAGFHESYYTNSTQLPVGYTDDIFETLDLQDELQTKYTGGTVLHVYLGEVIEDIELVKRLIKKIFTKYKLPYISLTNYFSICPEHGYIAGEIDLCDQCGNETAVWTRVTGYLRPKSGYNKGKKEEHRERVKYMIGSGDLEERTEGTLHKDDTIECDIPTE